MDADSLNPKLLDRLKSMTPDQVIKEAAQQLDIHPDRDHLIQVLRYLDALAIDHPQVNVWRALAPFTFPFPRAAAQGFVIISPALHDREMSLDEAMDSIWSLIDAGVEDDTPYLFGAFYHEYGDDTKRAKKVLDTALEQPGLHPLLRLYRSQITATNYQNKARFKDLLLPILEAGVAVPHDTRAFAFTKLFLIYVALKDFMAASLLRNRFEKTDNLFMGLGLSHLVYYALDDRGNIVSPAQLLLDEGNVVISEFVAGVREHNAISADEDDDEMLNYRGDLIIYLLISAWEQGRVYFSDRLRILTDRFPDACLDDREFIDALTAAKVIFPLLADIDDRSDLWAILHLLMLAHNSGRNPSRERLTAAAELARRYPCPLLDSYRLQHDLYLAKAAEVGGDLIERLYTNALWLCGGKETELEWNYAYFGLTPTQAGGPRPLPYFTDYFIDGMQAAEYPDTFIRGIWRAFVRPAITDDAHRSDERCLRLATCFDALWPHKDPQFLQGWWLLVNHYCTDAIDTLEDLLHYQPDWYAVYRNISSAYEKLGDIPLAYQYEHLAHEQPGMDIPEQHREHLADLAAQLEDYREQEETFQAARGFYQPKADRAIKVGTLTLPETIRLIALVEHFAIEGVENTWPILSQDYHWLPDRDGSERAAAQMIADGSAYLSNPGVGQGLTPRDDGSFSVDYAIATLVPNIEPIGNWPVVLGNLYQRLDALLGKLSSDEVREQLTPFLVEDLTAYAHERFEAYGIHSDYNAQFESTAQHCLEIYPLGICYGTYYHAIEDAAARQREVSMSDPHTVNFALSSVRRKATYAIEHNWDLRPYERANSASPPCAVIQTILGVLEENHSRGLLRARKLIN